MPASLVPGLRTVGGEHRTHRGPVPPCAILEHGWRTSPKQENPTRPCPCAGSCPVKNVETRIERLEASRGTTCALVSDRSPWDWYAPSCPCGLPAGECRASTGSRNPAAARGRLASVGLCGGARGRQDAGGGRVDSAPGRARRDETRLLDRPHFQRHSRRDGRRTLRAAQRRAAVDAAKVRAIQTPCYLATAPGRSV